MNDDGSIDVDVGRLRGGFNSEYWARIVPSQNSPLVRTIAAVTGTDRLPKTDVEFGTGNTAWSCAFEGVPGHTSVVSTPNPKVALVILDGRYEAYLIDVTTRQTTNVRLRAPVECIASDVCGKRLFVATAINVVAIGRGGPLWQSRRVSLDGIERLVYSDGIVYGVGKDLAGSDVPFSIEARSGATTGGYSLLE
jgi:hypothetical protein